LPIGSGIWRKEVFWGDDPDKESVWVQLARYSQLAFIFPAATIAGWLIGAGLDRWLHTSWLYLAGLILGIVAGFVELIRTAMSGSK
jgi:F0F1-type ATP synthase assembly protein I